MAKLAFTCGVLVATSSVLLVNSQYRENVKKEIQNTRETFVENWTALKKDLEELIDIGIRLKDAAVAYIKNTFPILVQKYEQLVEDIKPHIEEYREYLLQIDSLIKKIETKIKAFY